MTPRTSATTAGSREQQIREHRQQFARGLRRNRRLPAFDVLDGWTLPLPGLSRPVSMNDRGHWATKSREVARVRQLAWQAACERGLPVCHRLAVELHYRPRDVRRRDPINLMGTLKPAQDGLVDASLVPDDTPEFMELVTPVIHDPSHGPRGELWLVVRPLWRCTYCGTFADRFRLTGECSACSLSTSTDEDLRP